MLAVGLGIFVDFVVFGHDFEKPQIPFPQVEVLKPDGIWKV
jgi:hypothetical protein